MSVWLSSKWWNALTLASQDGAAIGTGRSFDGRKAPGCEPQMTGCSRTRVLPVASWGGL